MNGTQRTRSRAGVLRPWPFGPPLRGRASHTRTGTCGPQKTAVLKELSSASVANPTSQLLYGFVL
jgi:hypothetical protein